jgi:ubiquinone/menaquinone biosynthesis C-methylase UbiE
MAFLFPHQSATRLDSPERLKKVPAERLLSCLPLRKGCRFVDVGCGTGTYFFPVFEKLNGEGVFIAAELQEEMLRHFLSRLEAYTEHPRFTRIEVARAKPDRLPLPSGSADLILLAQVWHEISDRAAYLRELLRVLCPGGTLCLLDWNTAAEEAEASAEALPAGPPLEERVSENQAVLELESAGFEWLVSHGGFPQNWCLTARRPPLSVR